MATTVGELNVRLNLELQRLDAQVSQANAKIARMSKGWHSDVAKSARKINAALATIGLGVSFAGVASFGKKILDLGGQINDLSKQANIGTDAFQDFRYVAMENGATGEQVADMFAKMRKAVQDAVDGNKTLNAAFDRLNLNARALKKLAPETQFELIARAVANASDQQEAYNAASDIFGAKIAPKMMQFLDAVASGGMSQAQDALKDFRLSEDQIQTLDEAGDRLTFMVDQATLLAAKWGLFAANQLGIGTSGMTRAEMEDMPVVDSRSINGPGAPISTFSLDPEERIKELQAQQAAAAEAARIEQINADVIKATAEANKQAEAAMKDRAAADEKYFAAMRKQDAELDAIAESTRRMIDPSREYTAQIEEVNRALAANKLRSKEAAAAIDKIRAASVDAQLEDFFGDLDQKSADNMSRITEESEKAKDAARELGMTFSSAFEDAIVGGEKFSDVLRGLAQDLVRLALRKNITEPLYASLFSSESAIGGLFGGFFADGGRPPVGRPSVVGEDGAELFVPDSAGTIVSNDRLREAIGGGGGGISVSIVQKFEAGVSQAQLAEGLRQTYEAAKSGVMDAIQRRRGGFGALSAA